MRVTATWDWKDQGWGNLKGQLMVEALRDGEVVAAAGLSPEVAKHDWESKTFDLEAGDFIEHCQPGTVIRVMRYVGGGGGHELFLRNFRLGFIGGNTVFK
jgi:hypothetical protein